MLQRSGTCPVNPAPCRPRIADLHGLWRRTLIVWPDGARDTTTRVRWLQGPRAYIDLRQPPGLWRSSGQAPGKPDTARLRCQTELSLEDCLLLARQEGFAGFLTCDDAHFQWQRAIDFQPPATHPDASVLHWERNVLIETGRNADYIGHWQREPAAPTRPTCTLELWDRHSKVRATWLRVGPFFMFARDRATALTGWGSLEAMVATAPSLEHARELVSCEVSFGSIHRASFVISASTLPWRAGDALRPQLKGDCLTLADRAPDGGIILRKWEVIAFEGDLGPEAAI